MGNGYNEKLDALVGKPAKLKRSNNEREYFVVALRKYDEQDTKVDFARFFDANTGRQLRQAKLGRLTMDEARRIGKALCKAADAVLGVEKKAKRTRKPKPKAEASTTEQTSTLQEDVKAAEEANLLLNGE